LINCFKSYSSLGDDYFFVSPCILTVLHSAQIHIHYKVFCIVLTMKYYILGQAYTFK